MFKSLALWLMLLLVLPPTMAIAAAAHKVEAKSFVARPRKWAVCEESIAEAPLRELQNSNLGQNPRLLRRIRIFRKSPILNRIWSICEKPNRLCNHRILAPKRVLQLPLECATCIVHKTVPSLSSNLLSMSPCFSSHPAIRKDMRYVRSSIGLYGIHFPLC